MVFLGVFWFLHAQSLSLSLISRLLRLSRLALRRLLLSLGIEAIADLLRLSLPASRNRRDNSLRLQLRLLLTGLFSCEAELLFQSRLHFSPNGRLVQDVPSSSPLGLGLALLVLGLLLHRFLRGRTTFALDLQLTKVQLTQTLLSIKAELRRQSRHDLVSRVDAGSANDLLVRVHRNRESSHSS